MKKRNLTKVFSLVLGLSVLCSVMTLPVSAASYWNPISGTSEWVTMGGNKDYATGTEHAVKTAMGNNGLTVTYTGGEYTPGGPNAGVMYAVPVSPDGFSVEFTVTKRADYYNTLGTGVDSWISLCLLNKPNKYFNVNKAGEAQGIVTLIRPMQTHTSFEINMLTNSWGNAARAAMEVQQDMQGTFAVEIRKGADDRYDYIVNGVTFDAESYGGSDFTPAFTRLMEQGSVYFYMGVSSKDSSQQIEWRISKINGTAVTPSTPSTPSTPGATDNPGTTETPGTPSTPGTPGTPGATDNPGTTETPGTTDVPGATDGLNIVGETTGVKVEAASGVLPENTTVNIAEVNGTELKTDVKKNIEAIADKYIVYNIIAQKENVAVAANGALKVIFSVPEKYDIGKITICFVTEEGNIKEISSVADAAGKTVSAEVTDFGMYVIAEKKAEDTKNNDSADNKTDNNKKGDTKNDKTDTKEKTEKSHTGLIIGIVIVILLAAGGTVAFIIVKQRKGKMIGKDETEENYEENA